MNVTVRTDPTGVAFRRRRMTRAVGLVSSVAVAVGFGAVAASPAVALAADECVPGNTVVSDGTDQTAALQGVIDESAVLCLSGTFLLSAGLTYDLPLTVYGDGTAVLDGDDAWRILAATEEVALTVDSVSFQRGFGGDGEFVTGAGGAISGFDVTVRGSSFSGNTAVLGGAVVAVGQLVVDASEFTGNSAVDFTGDQTAIAGAIAAAGNFVITDSSFSDNTSEFGGAIFGYGTASLVGSEFVDNTATLAAGAVVTLGAITVAGSEFSGNSTQGPGGAIVAQTGVTVDSSVFTANTADGPGGAVYSLPTSFTSVTNSTFVGNVGAEGGAVYLDNGEVSFSSFLNNSATGSVAEFEVPGDALYKGGTTATLKGNIFAGSGSTPQLGTGDVVDPVPFSDAGGNVFSTSSAVEADLEADLEAGDASVFGASIEAVFGASPALADNGGPTATLALVAGSPAIDLIEAEPVLAGARGLEPVSVDQRGVARGELLDAGAFEFVAAEEETVAEETVAEVTPAALPELAATGPASVTGMAGSAALLLALGAALAGLRRRVRV